MARAAAVLGALWRAVRRDAKTLGSFTGNNIFYVSVVLLAFDDRPGALALNVMIGLALFFPLSADPLRKIPAERLAIWPIGKGERGLLRILSPWLNPMSWILAALVVSRSVTMGLWALVAALVTIGFVVPSIPWGGRGGSWRGLPPFPGPLGQLIRKNLREMLTSLDFYCGLMLSVGALLCRVQGLLPREALLPMTMLVSITLSSYAQCLFGLDGDGGLTRYRLLPVPGWQLLAAKDAAFLLASLALCLPLDPVAGLAAALVALALGHRTSVIERRPQTRWRFSTGARFGSGIFQVVAMALASAAAVYVSWLVIVACGVAYGVSTWWYGRAMETAG